MLLMILAASTAAFIPGFSSGIRPLSSPGYWIMPGDYPSEALQWGQQGYVEVRLEIAPNGMPSGCDITKSSEFKVLDTATCVLLLKRARFQTIKTPDGQAITGVYRGAFSWLLPEMGPLKRPPNIDLELAVQALPKSVKSPAVINAQIIVDAKGGIESCTPDWGDALPALGEVACQQVKATLHTLPARDASGANVRSLQVARVQFTADH